MMPTLLAILIPIALLTLLVAALERSLKQRRKKRRQKVKPARAKPPPKPAATLPPPAPVPIPPPPAFGATSAGYPGASAMAQAAQLHAEAANWEKGVAGEQHVAALLAQLPYGWHVFHDLPLGTRGANLDHLVVGPTGVFALNTKNYSGQVWAAERAVRVNGTTKNYLYPAAVKEARRVSDALSRATGTRVDAWPVLVFIGSVTVKAFPTDLTILHAGQLVPWLMGHAPRLDQPGIDVILHAAAHPRTWSNA